MRLPRPRFTVRRLMVAVAVVAVVLGLSRWLWNKSVAFQVVDVVDEEEPIRRFGYVYGTLPDHAETGHERFLVEWDQAGTEVWYDILAFSPAPLAHPAGISVCSACPEAIRQGVGGGHAEGRRQRGGRRSLIPEPY